MKKKKKKEKKSRFSSSAKIELDKLSCRNTADTCARAPCTRTCGVSLAGHVPCCGYHTRARTLPPRPVQRESRAGISGFQSVCTVCTHSFTFVPPLSARSSTASGHALSEDTHTRPLSPVDLEFPRNNYCRGPLNQPLSAFG